jgi:hypothetical protein
MVLQVQLHVGQVLLLRVHMLPLAMPLGVACAQQLVLGCVLQSEEDGGVVLVVNKVVVLQVLLSSLVPSPMPTHLLSSSGAGQQSPAPLVHLLLLWALHPALRQLLAAVLHLLLLLLVLLAPVCCGATLHPSPPVHLHQLLLLALLLLALLLLH